MKRLVAAAALLGGLTACSSLGDGNGAVAIEVLVASPASVEVNDTIQLRARLLDQDGDSIGGTIRWRTPDTAKVGLDSITGKFWGRATGTGRAQAVSGSLVGPITTYSVREHADTLIIPAAGDTLFVVGGDSQSAVLTPKVATAAGVGVQDATVILTLLFPADSSALLNGTVKADTVLTDGTGAPALALRVKQHGLVRPDSAVVQVQARRPSGAVVPGSGQVIRVIFQ